MTCITHMRTSTLALCLLAATDAAQSPEGRTPFQSRYSGWHGTDGNGGEHGPSILARVQARSDVELASFLKEGVPLRGMPAFADVPAAEMTSLVAFLKTTIAPAGGGRGGRGGRGGPVRTKVQLAGGKTLEGAEIGRTSREVQLRTDDQRIHLLRKSGTEFREVTSQSDWPSMHGQFSGNRYTTMTQISPANVAKLALKWVYSVPNAARL